MEVVNEERVRSQTMQTIKARMAANWDFHFELDFAMSVWDILLELQVEQHPRIINYHSMVRCAINNWLMLDFNMAPMHISYVYIVPDAPPQWMIDLAARNRAKRSAANL